MRGAARSAADASNRLLVHVVASHAHTDLSLFCTQDGTVAVWDARSGACASRCLLPSAARCVKWAAPPLDLLAVAEHEARISLLDARRWGSGQALALGGAVRGAVRGGAGLRSLDVSGIAFSPSVSAAVHVVLRRLYVGSRSQLWNHLLIQLT